MQASLGELSDEKAGLEAGDGSRNQTSDPP